MTIYPGSTITMTDKKFPKIKHVNHLSRLTYRYKAKDQ